ncbi:MAG TPA: hypothetical protein VGO11_27980 [Chthoniobacteraceae bacterium]|jgi:hypothetical protein|nr:hypothetical protein [Chthoniobacteraceae bacterium]
MIEALESRIAPAGLTYSSYHGILTIKGIPAGNFALTEYAGGDIQVTHGPYTSGVIHGIKTISILFDADPIRADLIDFILKDTHVTTISVNGGGGNDTVRFIEGGAGVSATVHGGDGNDTVEVVSAGAQLRRLTFAAGQGNNTLKVSGPIALSANFTSFDGADTLNLTSTGSIGTLYTTLGRGNDTVTLDGAVTALAQISTNNDSDTINFNAQSHVHVLNISSGTEGDFITLAGTVDGSIYVNASNGDDHLTLTPGVKAGGNLTAVMGQGADTVNLAGTFFNANIYGGTDNDRVDLSNGLVIGNVLNIALGTGNNIVASALPQTQLLNTAYRIIVSASTGDDQVQLSGFDVKTSIGVSLGAGANSFQIPARSLGAEIPALKAASLTYSGGAGIDTVNVQSSESVIGIGTFYLSYGNDEVHFTGSKSIFTSAIRVYGSLGMDILTGQSLFTNLTHTYSSIESLS